MSTEGVSYRRPHATVLARRLAEPRRFIQVEHPETGYGRFLVSQISNPNSLVMVADLIRRPNAGQGRAELFEAVYGHLLLSGNAYIEAVAGAGTASAPLAAPSSGARCRSSRSDARRR